MGTGASQHFDAMSQAADQYHQQQMAMQGVMAQQGQAEQAAAQASQQSAQEAYQAQDGAMQDAQQDAALSAHNGGMNMESTPEDVTADAQPLPEPM